MKVQRPGQPGRHAGYGNKLDFWIPKMNGLNSNTEHDLIYFEPWPWLNICFVTDSDEIGFKPCVKILKFLLRQNFDIFVGESLK